jgi:hypothetical protein
VQQKRPARPVVGNENPMIAGRKRHEVVPRDDLMIGPC